MLDTHFNFRAAESSMGERRFNVEDEQMATASAPGTAGEEGFLPRPLASLNANSLGSLRSRGPVGQRQSLAWLGPLDVCPACSLPHHEWRISYPVMQQIRLCSRRAWNAGRSALVASTHTRPLGGLWPGRDESGRAATSCWPAGGTARHCHALPPHGLWHSNLFSRCLCAAAAAAATRGTARLGWSGSGCGAARRQRDRD